MSTRHCRTCGETLKPGYWHRHKPGDVTYADVCRFNAGMTPRAYPLHYIAGKPYELVLDKGTGATVLAPVPR